LVGLGWAALAALTSAQAQTPSQPEPAAAGAGGRQLQAIDVQPLPGQRLELRLRLNEAAPKPMSFTIDRPARIALDLPNTSLALPSRRKDVNMGPVTTVLAAEANGRTRIVLNMTSMVPYQTRVEGDSVYIDVGQSVQGGSTATFAAQAPGGGSSAGAAATGAPDANAQAARTIENIDFRRGPDGSGQVQVTLSDPHTSVNVQQQGGRVLVDFQNTSLPAKLMRRLDVTDFATPVATVDAMSTDGDTRLVVTPSKDFEQLAYQSDNLFTLELKPKQEQQQTQQSAGIFDENKKYTGQRLTLNFQDIETRAVLQLLADTSGQNIVVSDSVKGNLTLRLQNVPWDQALDIVLATKGLAMRRNGNVILVAPAEEIAAREQAQAKAAQAKQDLEPLHTEFIQVNYAKAADLATLIKGSGNSGGGGGGASAAGAGGAGTGGNSLLSDRGSIAIDERTNTLLVHDTPSNIENIRRLVATLDVPVKQVLIQSRIVIVNDDYTRNLGVRLGSTITKQRHSNGLVSLTGNGTGSDTIVQSGISNVNSTGQPFPVTVPPIDQRYNVNLPVANPTGSLALAVLDSDYLVDLELSAMQAEGKGRIESSPRVITANQREAQIKQGVEIPYQQSASSGATTTQFKDAVLSLTVTPQITPDNRIIMDLAVTKDSVGQSLPSATGGNVPSIDTRSIQTQVLVDDGGTVVLGGIYETENRTNTNKVPVLGDIPGLGYLFRQRERVNNNDELLIFVTPKILREGASGN
jgi:type IV pilus assembly protein PilQ